MTGINIQTPWSNMLINGVKTIETRSYPLPKKYEGIELVLVETQGNKSNFISRAIGTIVFSCSIEYSDQKSWQNDYFKHKVSGNDKNFGWKPDKKKYGWIVIKVKKFEKPIDITQRKGIIFTTGLKLKKEQFNESECH